MTDPRRAQAEREIAAVNRALAAGYPPRGIKGNNHNPSAIAIAAKELGLNESSIRRRVGYPDSPGLWARLFGLVPNWGAYTEETPAPSFAHVPDDDLPPEQLISIMAERQQRMRAAAAARRWREIRIEQTRPFGIVWFTDVHLGDNGTDYAALMADLETAAGTPHVYSAFIGDASNNWPTDGRLAKKWADQETSARTERRLVEWFMRDAGQRWLFWVLGNHDAWANGAEILHRMNIEMIPMEDWRAKFRLVLQTGREVRIDAAHDFKGNSQWNSLQGLVKEAKWGEEAHLYIAGHRHTAAIHQEEIAERSTHHKPWLVRARGYKMMDEYAHRHQFAEQQSGKAVITIIDPQHDGPNPITHVFDDIQRGAEFLTWLRGRA